MKQTQLPRPPLNPTVAATRRYNVGLALAMAAYLVVLFATIWTIRHYDPQGFLRFVLALAPLVPIALIVPIGVRYFRETDEFERRMTTESLAIAAGVTALLSATYAFLENAGLPPLSAWWTWTVLMLSWAVARMTVCRRYR